jgi:hypothetical protein
MNLVKNINQYNEENIYFCEPIKNNIMNEGTFIRILYSTSIVTINGVYLLINMSDITCDKYYNKYKCNFNTLHNKDIIDNIKTIEENILRKIGIQHKQPQLKIYEQLRNGNIKLFSEVNKSSCSFILKISGIWETQYHYGLTYKFIKINN